MKLKKITAILLVVSLCFAISPMVFANESEQLQYTFPDGTVINYALDENMMPYIYENGEKVLVALSLPHLRVTDEAKIKELNAELKSARQRAVPSYYVDLSTGSASDASERYSTTHNFTNSSSFITPVLKFNRSHTTLHTNKNVSGIHICGEKFVLYYSFYDFTTDEWNVLKWSNQRCCTEAKINHSPSVYEYGRVDVTRKTVVDHNVDISVHTSLIW